MEVSEKSTTSQVAEAAKIHVNVRLVLARVVVRDSSGQAVGSLQKEDFEIFDNGKPQVISNFDMVSASNPAPTISQERLKAIPGEVPATPTVSFPTRYVAYVFDDVRLNFAELARVREAALHRIAELSPAERIAVLTTSGRPVLDFTDEGVELRRTLAAVHPDPTQVLPNTDCPYITLYMADLIVNKFDRQALKVAVDDYMSCMKLPSESKSSAGGVVQELASHITTVGEQDARVSLRVLEDTAQRMATLPGQKSIVLVSPGFLTSHLEYEFNELVDHALRTQVVISSLDARGLYVTIPGGDASASSRPDPLWRTTYEVDGASRDSDILGILAVGTGGVFFQNNNDMNEGFRRVSATPEYYYVLGFTPENLKNDGKFHTIKVKLANHQHYELQARRGYYAPQREVDPAREIRHAIEDEVFAREELRQLPVNVHTEFFKPSEDLAKLTVLTRVDVKRLRYRQANGRNLNELTVITAIFDRNGNFLQADQKLVKMRWTSDTLQTKLGSGITLKSAFDLKPGAYLIRVVSRDGEQQVMSAENGAVEIP